jgi:GTP pyrophosphokinase
VEYLRRIMLTGSERAKILKLADRISNIWALGFVHDVAFVTKYLHETRTCILPHAEQVNADMFKELSDLVESREAALTLSLRGPVAAIDERAGLEAAAPGAEP